MEYNCCFSDERKKCQLEVNIQDYRYCNLCTPVKGIRKSLRLKPSADIVIVIFHLDLRYALGARVLMSESAFGSNLELA